jgi:hypothetical protein
MIICRHASRGWQEQAIKPHGELQAQVFSLVVGNDCEPRSGRREGSAVQSFGMP